VMVHGLDSRFGSPDSGSRIQGLGFRFSGLGLRVYG
jgi:hypothetical protein